MDHRSGDTDRADTLRAVSQAFAGRALQVLQPSVQHIPCTEHIEDTSCERGSCNPVSGQNGIRAECEHCSGPLPDGSSANRMYCSKECKQAVERARRQAARIKARQGRKCLWCGGSIPAGARGDVIYCNKTCQTQSQIDMQKTRRTCRQCGKTFRGFGKHCSCACAGHSRRKRHPKQCPVCQKTFKPHRIEQVCCSQPCRYEQAKRMKGG